MGCVWRTSLIMSKLKWPTALQLSRPPLTLHTLIKLHSGAAHPGLAFCHAFAVSTKALYLQG